jgi:hypothetical protein
MKYRLDLTEEELVNLKELLVDTENDQVMGSIVSKIRAEIVDSDTSHGESCYTNLMMLDDLQQVMAEEDYLDAEPLMEDILMALADIQICGASECYHSYTSKAIKSHQKQHMDDNKHQ